MSQNENYRGYELDCALYSDGTARCPGTWVGTVRYRLRGAKLFKAMMLTVLAGNARAARLRVRAVARERIDRLADQKLKNVEQYGIHSEAVAVAKPLSRVIVIEQMNGLYRVNITFGRTTILKADCDLSLITLFRTARAAEIEGIIWAKELMSGNLKANNRNLQPSRHHASLPENVAPARPCSPSPCANHPGMPAVRTT